MNVTIINDLKIGSLVKIGAGSVVINKQKPGITVFEILQDKLNHKNVEI